MLVPDAMKHDLMRFEEQERVRSVRFAWHRPPRSRRTRLLINKAFAAWSALPRKLARRAAGPATRPASAHAAHMVSPAEPP
ncbi:MAG TPA: hypothetical protein VKB69_07870 [Micromonosporaceae bacterium]|nr:hypothetical protein [Micromonosporaceae bacterium]